MKLDFFHKNNLTKVGLITACILLIPLIGMLVSQDWHWDLADFIIFGLLVSGAGLMVELVAAKIKIPTHRIALTAIIILACLYVWAEMAVGIFTNFGN